MKKKKYQWALVFKMEQHCSWPPYGHKVAYVFNTRREVREFRKNYTGLATTMGKPLKVSVT